jgi:hypothetical protein
MNSIRRPNLQLSLGHLQVATTVSADDPMELRKTKRYLLSAPASFRCECSEGIPQKGEGTTRDISAKGVFVLSKLGPQLGAHIELDVYLPSLSGSPRLVQLHGEGKVIRKVNSGSSESGFAAEILFDTEKADPETLMGSGGRVQ